MMTGLYKSILSVLLFGGGLALVSCDEGDITGGQSVIEQTGRTARLTGKILKADQWPSGYSVVLAGFDESSEYALTGKTVDARLLDEGGSVTLSGIPAEATVVELCVIDRLRRRVATFASVTCADTDEELLIDAGVVDVGPMAGVQKEVFNTTCVNCHGGSGHAAASLLLRTGESHGELVGVKSVVDPDFVRVVPGDPEKSLLYRILSTDYSSTWHYDHSVEVVSDLRLSLVRSWIEAGAPD